MSVDRLKGAFARGLGVPADAGIEGFEYNAVPIWDSVAHMALIAAIEEEFDILIDTDDVIDMSSFAKAREIVAKYGVEA